MKKVDFKTLRAGDLVQVPRTEFAPLRQGWNGWLFSDAVVIRKALSAKTKKPVVRVEMCLPKNKNDYRTVEKVFYAEHVFQTNAVENAKRFLSPEGVTDKESFYAFLEREDVSGCDELKFLVDKGFLFD